MAAPKEPENYWRDIFKGFIVIVAISVFMALLEFNGAIAGIEGKLQDLFWLRHNDAPMMDSMVIFEIDKDAYRSFFGSASPLCSQIVTGLVREINSVPSGAPAVIGVDILTEGRTANDRKIYQDFSITPSNRNVVWASGAEAEDQPPRIDFLQWLFGKDEEAPVRPTPVLGFDPYILRTKPEIDWGPAVYPTQDDLKLRRFPRRLTLATDPRSKEPNEIRATWARVIANRYCAALNQNCRPKPPNITEVYLNFAGLPPTSFSIDKFFERSGNPDNCDGTVGVKKDRQALLANLIKDKIVLLGGTYPQSADFHPTPADPKEAGIVINARAIAAEMKGDGFTEIQQPWSFLLDLLTGFVVVLFMTGLKKWRNWEPRTARKMMVTSAVTAVVIIYALAKSHYLFSPAAVVLATLIQQLYDFWRGDLVIPEAPGPTHTAPKPRQRRPPR